MSFTLWRGNQLLGALHALPHLLEESSSDAEARLAFAGVLLPDAEVGDIYPLMQGTFPMAPGAPTFQTPGTVVYAEEPPDGTPTTARPPSHAFLSPLSAEEARGVPASQRLRIHSTAAATLPTRMLDLSEYRIALDILPLVLPEIPVAAWHRGSLWYVLAQFESEPPAT